MKRFSTQHVLNTIGCPYLDLVYDRSGYWYFIYDDKDKIFETHSVWSTRLNSLMFEHWVAIGKSFVKKVESKDRGND